MRPQRKENRMSKYKSFADIPLGLPHEEWWWEHLCVALANPDQPIPKYIIERVEEWTQPEAQNDQV